MKQTKRMIRKQRRAKMERRDMHMGNVIAEVDFAEAEKRVLAAMDANQGFHTGEDIYGGYPPGSPERKAVKDVSFMEQYGITWHTTVTGRTRCK